MSDISDEIDRESSIIEDLLTMVRLDKSNTELQVKQVNINELLELILKRLTPIAEKRDKMCIRDSDKTSLISELTVEEAEDFVKNGNVGGGMIPKLTNCIDALREGVSRVHILDGRIPHCLLLEIFTNRGIGTAILNGNEERYFHEQ